MAKKIDILYHKHVAKDQATYNVVIATKKSMKKAIRSYVFSDLSLSYTIGNTSTQGFFSGNNGDRIHLSDLAVVQHLKRHFKERNPIARLKNIHIPLAESHKKWKQAKAENDFDILAPALSALISKAQEIARKRAEGFSEDMLPSDIYLDDVSPGLRTAYVSDLMDQTLATLKPLYDQKKAFAKNPQNSHLYKMSLADQERLYRSILKDLGLENIQAEYGFAPATFGANANTAMTSIYDIEDFTCALSLNLHEAFHCLFRLSMPQNRVGQLNSLITNMAIDETVALFAENHIFTSKAFSEYLIKKMQDLNLPQARELSADELHHHINFERPMTGFGSDRVGYVLSRIVETRTAHDLINGVFPAHDFKKEFNQAHTDILGFEPISDRAGCVKDIHIPSAKFGYKANYLVASITAPYIFNSLNQSAPQWQDCLGSHKDWGPVKEFIRNKITANYNIGSDLSLQGFMERITGRKALILSPNELARSLALN